MASPPACWSYSAPQLAEWPFVDRTRVGENEYNNSREIRLRKNRRLTTSQTTTTPSLPSPHTRHGCHLSPYARIQPTTHLRINLANFPGNQGPDNFSDSSLAWVQPLAADNRVGTGPSTGSMYPLYAMKMYKGTQVRASPAVIYGSDCGDCPCAVSSGVSCSTRRGG